MDWLRTFLYIGYPTTAAVALVMSLFFSVIQRNNLAEAGLSVVGGQLLLAIGFYLLERQAKRNGWE